MKLTVVGCGNAFSMKNFNQSFLLEEDGRTMILDFGRDIPNALHNLNIPLSKIDDVYISHLHADHIGGLEFLAFSRYDWLNKPEHWSLRSEKMKAPRMIANNKLIKDVWLALPGLKSIEGIDATLETFFEPMPIVSNKEFNWQGWTVQLIQQIHIMTGSSIVNTYGIFFKKEGHKSIYFTTDSQHCSPRQIEVFYKQADIILQDCEIIGVDMVKKEFKFASGVHANYAQLAGYPSANSVKLSDSIKEKMYLSHYQDFFNSNKDGFGNDCDWQAKAKEDGFAGFVSVGQTMEF